MVEQDQNAKQDEGRVLVIGYGNPMRGDDGAGWWAAERVEERVGERAKDLGVEVQVCHQLFPEMAEPISRAGRVVFIDAAVVEGGKGGEVKERAVEAKEEGVMGVSMTHHLTPEGVLALARELFGRCPEARLYTIGAVEFGHVEGLSEAVRRGCEGVVGRVMASLAEGRGEVGRA